MLEQIKTISKNIPNEIEILQCKVLEISPLEIQVVDESKRIIPESYIILSQNVTKYTVYIKLKDENETKEYEIDNSLKIGDIVLVVSFNESQKFIIIDKVV